ncbi:putative protein kinase [Tetraselmis virus 1]|uniref:Protein kinase domain-containing protein n=1 Tax=Tetraselmis virus 1 TaxID=2060617 RepID=A0A2P0VPC3_9VIRU|nr:putative protein kinase [Tetraselmis virus 1]AUF82740.1 putative protein kinase [Tetraselmis virus 1]
MGRITPTFEQKILLLLGNPYNGTAKQCIEKIKILVPGVLGNGDNTKLIVSDLRKILSALGMESNGTFPVMKALIVDTPLMAEHNDMLDTMKVVPNNDPESLEFLQKLCELFKTTKAKSKKECISLIASRLGVPHAGNSTMKKYLILAIVKQFKLPHSNQDTTAKLLDILNKYVFSNKAVPVNVVAVPCNENNKVLQTPQPHLPPKHPNVVKPKYKEVKTTTPDLIMRVISKQEVIPFYKAEKGRFIKTGPSGNTSIWCFDKSKIYCKIGFDGFSGTVMEYGVNEILDEATTYRKLPDKLKRYCPAFISSEYVKDAAHAYLLIESIPSEYKCMSDLLRERRDKPLTDEEKARIVKKLIEINDYIHYYNLSHGDFHSGNFMFNKDFTSLRIIDLGYSIVRQADGHLWDPLNSVYHYSAHKQYKANHYSKTIPKWDFIVRFDLVLSLFCSVDSITATVAFGKKYKCEDRLKMYMHRYFNPMDRNRWYLYDIVYKSFV